MHKNSDELAKLKKSIIREPRKELIICLIGMLLKVIAVVLAAIAIANGVNGFLGILLVILSVVTGTLFAGQDLPNCASALSKYVAAKNIALILEEIANELGEDISKYEIKIIFDEGEDEDSNHP